MLLVVVKLRIFERLQEFWKGKIAQNKIARYTHKNMNMQRNSQSSRRCIWPYFNHKIDNITTVAINTLTVLFVFRWVNISIERKGMTYFN